MEEQEEGQHYQTNGVHPIAVKPVLHSDVIEPVQQSIVHVRHALVQVTQVIQATQLHLHGQRAQTKTHNQYRTWTYLRFLPKETFWFRSPRLSRRHSSTCIFNEPKTKHQSIPHLEIPRSYPMRRYGSDHTYCVSTAANGTTSQKQNLNSNDPRIQRFS